MAFWGSGVQVPSAPPLFPAGGTPPGSPRSLRASPLRALTGQPAHEPLGLPDGEPRTQRMAKIAARGAAIGVTVTSSRSPCDRGPSSVVGHPAIFTHDPTPLPHRAPRLPVRHGVAEDRSGSGVVWYHSYLRLDDPPKREDQSTSLGLVMVASLGSSPSGAEAESELEAA